MVYTGLGKMLASWNGLIENLVYIKLFGALRRDFIFLSCQRLILAFLIQTLDIFILGNTLFRDRMSEFLQEVMI